MVTTIKTATTFYYQIRLKKVQKERGNRETTLLKRQTLRIMNGDSCVAIFHYWGQDDLQREVEQPRERKLHYQLNNYQ